MNRYSNLRAILQSPWGLGALAFVAAVIVLLVIDHWTHIIQSNLTVAGLLLACAAMHFLMHGGHGGHGGGGGSEPRD